MDSERASRWFTLIANIGVLIGIFLLVIELTQNREMMRAQTRAAIAAIEIAHLDAVATDGELADIMLRSRVGEERTGTEGVRYLYHSLATIRNFENKHYQFRLGLFDEEEFAGELEGFALLIQGSIGLTQVWCQFRTATSREFRSEVDAMFESPACEQESDR